MHDTYTTINPNTGTYTTEDEFINSWKWKYSINDLNKDHFSFFSIKTTSGARNALISKYDLDPEIPLQSALRIHDMTLKEEMVRELYCGTHRELNDLFKNITVASSENKTLKLDQKKQNRKHAKFKQDIKSFLKHKENCQANIALKIGRIRNNIQCTCGLKEILKT